MIRLRRGKEWAYADDLSCENELATLLFSLVRLMKPDICLETGCHNGAASKAIAEGLNVNRNGLLYSCDTDEEAVTRTRDFLTGLPAAIFQSTGLDLCSRIKDVDLAYIDSGTDRAAEIEALQMAPGGIIILHDAHQHEYPGYEDVCKRLGRGIKIDTPLGVAIWQV